MLRFFLIAVGATAFVCGVAEASDKPTIPPGVKYKFIDDKLDGEIRASLAARFQKGEAAVRGLFQGPCIFAPGYWKLIADSGSLKHPIHTTFAVPNLKTGATLKMDGATTKDADDLQRIAGHFATDIGKTPVIRRLTTDEVGLMWALVPFDLDEPVYVLENGPRHFVICMVKGANEAADSYGIMWIDVLTEYNLGKPSEENGHA